MTQNILASETQPDPLVCAAEYYRAGLEKRAPKWVPASVRLAAQVRGDFPVAYQTVAAAGDHECESNKWGAISVKGSDGKLLGLRPAEFEVLTWRLNEKT